MTSEDLRIGFGHGSHRLLDGTPGRYSRSARQGQATPPPRLLALAVVALLAGMTSYEAIVDYGKERGWEFLQPLGSPPGAASARPLIRGSSAGSTSPTSRRGSAGGLRGGSGRGDAPHLALDGKTARGSRDGDTPGVHLLSAYAPDVKAVLAQLRVDAKTNEHKAARSCWGFCRLKGKVITGDAMFTHRDVCAAVIGGGGDYVLPVKENQPTLAADIEAAFAGPEAGLSPLQAARAGRSRAAAEVDKGHGRIERRTIEVTSSLA